MPTFRPLRCRGLFVLDGRWGMRVTRADGLVTRDQAAELCGVLPDTVSMWVRRGHLRVAKREGRTPLFDVIELARAEHATAKRARRQIIPTAA